MKRSNLILIAVALGLGAGCAKTDEARVERYESGVYHPQTVSTYTISGARDGATTEAVAVFTLEDGDRIRVELHVAYNPTPVLSSGMWRREGTTPEEGVVREEALTFLGGQGGTPSVGGRFRLESNGTPRWRVVMPTRPLGRAP